MVSPNTIKKFSTEKVKLTESDFINAYSTINKEELKTLIKNVKNKRVLKVIRSRLSELNKHTHIYDLKDIL